MNKGRKLQKYIVESWLLSGTIALVASFLLFFAFGYYNYFQEIQNIKKDLDSKAQVVARRLSGELLIAPRGSPDSVVLQVAKELNITDVAYNSAELIHQYSKSNDLIYSEVQVPFLENKYVLLAGINKPEMLAHFNFTILIICILIIGLIVGTGLFLQTRYLKRHLIRPIEALVDTSTGDRNISDHWPLELQEISQKLNNSFQERERVVYSQIARGVIHDIKTILQSMKAATDLANENASEARLKNLLKVTHAKLPSLLDLIDTTLDGSRDITISAESSSLTSTLNKSLETVRGLQIAQGKAIEIELQEDISIKQDPIQLERVFTNIFKNGLESIESKKSAEGLLKISFNLSNKDFVGVVVEDNGIGLPKSADSVFRLLKSTKPHGSGLGLLVSRKIVEAHGGKIIAGHSEQMLGAKFEVILPLGGSI